MLARRKIRRGLHQARQHRRLRQSQVFRLAVEVMQAGSMKTIAVVSEIGVGQITLEDLIFGQPPFQPERDQHFSHFAGQAAFGSQEGKFRQLLAPCTVPPVALDHAARARPRGSIPQCE